MPTIIYPIDRNGKKHSKQRKSKIKYNFGHLFVILYASFFLIALPLLLSLLFVDGALGKCPCLVIATIPQMPCSHSHQWTFYWHCCCLTPWKCRILFHIFMEMECLCVRGICYKSKNKESFVFFG